MEKPVEYVDKLAVLDALANVTLEVKGDAVACSAVKYIMSALAPKIQKAVSALPAAKVKPVVHAHWGTQFATFDIDTMEMISPEKSFCTNCGKTNKNYRPQYCPHCGAYMD